MDTNIILQPHIQDFIIKNENADVRLLALKGHLFPNLPLSLVIQQIAGRQKAKNKLPFLYHHHNIIYPPLLSLEQCSSEQTAQFKANLLEGKTLVDLTGGLGVDTYFFSKYFGKVDYIEQNADLAAVAKHNLNELGVRNIQFHAMHAEEFLKNLKTKIDCIYLDPARRNEANRKLVLLEDCEPNLLQLLPILLEKAHQVLVKTSPMLDIDLAMKSLGQNLQKVIVLAVDNECKEVLYLLGSKSATSDIETINIDKENRQQLFSFTKESESTASISYALPQQYLYEPNAAILKAGGFKSIASVFQINKLHLHSHLYTSTHLVPHFVGRSFVITAISKLDKKELKKYLPDNKANIAVRNFPISVEEIRKQTGIKEGGDIYLFATKDIKEKKIVLICHKIQIFDDK
ncbi:MAG: class I SAM-dependent methyltransferase [Thermoflexibacter sp.]|nr:class I SAM-dependent methyltransferase [Thermoflexibacter sp.]